MAKNKFLEDINRFNNGTDKTLHMFQNAYMYISCLLLLASIFLRMQLNKELQNNVNYEIGNDGKVYLFEVDSYDVTGVVKSAEILEDGNVKIIIPIREIEINGKKVILVPSGYEREENYFYKIVTPGVKEHCAILSNDTYEAIVYPIHHSDGRQSFAEGFTLEKDGYGHKVIPIDKPDGVVFYNRITGEVEEIIYFELALSDSKPPISL